jgi:16S rRNA (adenine1518-N6/adenine1519-N6)-dimethyltransferase
VEKDTQLVNILREELDKRGIFNVSLIHEDILRLDLEKATKGIRGKIKVVGNLPYNISSPLLERLFRHRDIISRAVLMFQVEFAKRLFSPPNCKDYGAITLLIGYHATVSPLFEVSREAFYPRPKVGSMVVLIDMEKPHQNRAEDESLFREVVKGAFAHRRKTVLNSLKRALQSYSGEEIGAALRRCSIDSKRRAETLDMDEFLCLADLLKRREI